jgi:uncharacterized protein
MLPGFDYHAIPMAGLSSATRWQFHVMQLRWLLTSPSLLAADAGLQYGCDTDAVFHFSSSELVVITEWLDELANWPEQQFASHLASFENSAADIAPLRLGRYAERLLSFFLRQQDRYQLLAERVALRSVLADRAGVATTGELDFVLRENDLILHWELAVKLYLCEATGNTATPDQFIGPDRKDSLQRKLSKVFQRQLQHSMPPPFDHMTVKRQAFSAGWLFYPHQQIQAKCAILNSQHSRGSWLQENQLATLPTGEYLAMPRWRWMALAQLMPGDQLIDSSVLADRLVKHWSSAAQEQKTRGRHAIQQVIAKAILLARIDGNGTEVERFFVRPDLGHPSDSSR